MSYAEALDGALCYGWIDAQKKSYDDTFWLQKFTPRRPKSVWSKVNTDKVTLVIESGKIVHTASLDEQKSIAFNFQVSAEPGTHRVVLRKGADVKQLDFWVGEPLPVAQVK